MHPCTRQTHHGNRRRGGASHECCTDGPCDSGLRNQYFEGKRLTADSFRVEQSYLLERRRLLNRAIHGWGVVYGYAVKPARTADPRTKDEVGALEIGPGLALDECGRELLLARATSLRCRRRDPSRRERRAHRAAARRELRAVRKQQHGEKRPRACWLLSAHYAEQSVGPIKINDPCSCERKEWEHVCETVRFSLRRVDCEECCAQFDCELKCGCGTGPCCGQHPEERPRSESYPEKGGERYESANPQKTPGNPVHRGGCQCLCEHLTGLTDAECGGLCEIEDPCVHIRVDLRNGVPLACVRLREGDCDNWVFDRWFEACGPRRLVKRNDVLFDLIRGCDLTRISAIGWAHWHRSKKLVEWDEFEASFGAPARAKAAWNARKTRSGARGFRRHARLLGRVLAAGAGRNRAGRLLLHDGDRRRRDEGGWDEALPRADPGCAKPSAPARHAGWARDARNARRRRRLGRRRRRGRKTHLRRGSRRPWRSRSAATSSSTATGRRSTRTPIGLSPAPTGNGTPGRHLPFELPRAAEAMSSIGSRMRAQSRSEGVES